MHQLTEIVTIRVPTGLKGVIDRASSRHGVNVSEFVRQCVMAGLASDGFPMGSRHVFPSIGQDKRPGT